MAENLSITSDRRQPIWANLRASLDAEVALANQEIAKDFLDLWETETCPKLKQFFADRYRRLVGIDPSRHDELQQALEQGRDGSGESVTDIIATVNRQRHEKGSMGFAADSVAGA